MDELKTTADIVRELGEDWRENMHIVNSALEGSEDILEAVRRLDRKSNQGAMVKVGLMLLAFPLPIVVDDLLGLSLVAAGLAQRKIKNSAAYVEDVQGTLQKLLRELRESQEGAGLK